MAYHSQHSYYNFLSSRRTMNQVNTPVLISQIFRKSVFEDIIFKSNHSIWELLLSDSSIKEQLEGLSLLQAFDYLYRIINKNYKNEYVFKNTIAHKILKGRHKLSSNVSYINEFHVLNSICDIAIFNGTSTAYEIKTEMDSFDRLESQLVDYKKIFSKIYIVTVQSKTKFMINNLPSEIGIIELTSRNNLSTIREACSSFEELSHAAMLSSLKYSEMLVMMKNLFDYEPSRSPKKTKQDCINLFESMPINYAHDCFVKILRQRCLNKSEKELIERLPYSLLGLILNIRPSKSKMEKIIYNLNNIII